MSSSTEYCSGILLSIALQAPASSSEALEDSEKGLSFDRTFSTHMEKDSENTRALKDCALPFC